MRFYIEAETSEGARQVHWAQGEDQALKVVRELLRVRAVVQIMEADPDENGPEIPEPA